MRGLADGSSLEDCQIKNILSRFKIHRIHRNQENQVDFGF